MRRPLEFPRNFNRVSAPDANSCAGCHNSPLAGGNGDIVAWTFDRASGGRSFNFSGLDAHAAWELEGMRKLVINGVLWSAGVTVPESGAPCEADKALVDSFLTPRTAPPAKKAKK